MRAFFLIPAFLLSGLAISQPVVSEQGRVKFNWGTMKLEFFGEAEFSDATGADALKNAEAAAWRDGISYVAEFIKKYQVDALGREEALADDISNKISRSTYSRNTRYFSNGAIRVELENSLARAIHPSVVLGAPIDSPDEANNSSIILKLSTYRDPSPVYRVITRTGEVLYDSKMVAPDSFAVNMMGRWFKKPSGAAYSSAVGKSPVQLKAEVQNEDLVVEKAAWEKAISGNQQLLNRAKIALLMP